MNTTAEARHDPRGQWTLALAAILLVATVLRVREALLTPFWFDETFTLWTVRAGLPSMFRLLALDTHPPLHSLLVWGWRAIGGENELWLKSLSIIFGLGTIAALYGFTRELFGARTALLAAALLALHRTAVYFSQEARSYGLLWLLLLLAAWTAWRWIERGQRRDAVLFVLSATAALYTHYLAGVVIGFLWMWGVIALHRDRARLLRWVGLHAVVAVLFTPQLPTLFLQMKRTHETWVPPATLATLLNLARQIALGATYLVVPWFAFALLPLFRWKEARAASLLLTVSLVPILTTFALTRLGVQTFFLERYLFLTLPAWCGLVAAGITGVRWRWSRWPLALLFLALDARSFALHHPMPEPVELQKAAAFLTARARPTDIVFCAEAHSLLFMQQHERGRARFVLLQTDPDLPYYEATSLIPAEWRVTPADFERARQSGARWWGVHARHGGMPGTDAAYLMNQYAAGLPHRFAMVTVWSGQPDSAAMADSTSRR